jgi:hypothetical protein
MSQGPGGPASESLDPPELLELPLEVEPEELPLLEVDPEELPLELDADVPPLELDPEELPLELDVDVPPLEADPEELPLPEVDPEELPLLEVDPEELPLELDVDVPPLEAAPEEPLLELLPDPDVLASGVALELSSLEPQEQRIAVAMAIG